MSSNNPMPKILVSTIIVSAASYFVGPMLGLDGISMAVGVLAGGVIAALLSIPGKSGTSKTKQPKQAPVSSSDGELQTLFVGNLAFRANRGALIKHFSPYGPVHNARIVVDRNTRKPRGYGFVEIPANNTDAAIRDLDGQEFFGRELKVSRANNRD